MLPRYSCTEWAGPFAGAPRLLDLLAREAGGGIANFRLSFFFRRLTAAAAAATAALSSPRLATDGADFDPFFVEVEVRPLLLAASSEAGGAAAPLPLLVDSFLPEGTTAAAAATPLFLCLPDRAAVGSVVEAAGLVGFVFWPVGTAVTPDGVAAKPGSTAAAPGGTAAVSGGAVSIGGEIVDLRWQLSKKRNYTN